MKKLLLLCVALASLMSLTACENLLIDTRDNQVYRIVTIGNQTWMAQNLNYRYDQQPKGDSSSYCYNNSADSCAKYGRFYPRHAAFDIRGQVPGNKPLDCSPLVSCNASGKIRGVCPDGWPLPSKAEWDTLFAVMGGPEAAAKKLRSTTGWNSMDNEGCGNGTDDSLFTVLPAGFDFIHYWDAPPEETLMSRTSSGQGAVAFFWSSTDIDSNKTDFVYFFACHEKGMFNESEEISQLQQMAFFEREAFSVRCIKD